MSQLLLRTQFSLSALGLVMGVAAFGADAAYATQLPVPCGAAACSPNAASGFSSSPSGFVTYGSATAAQSGKTLTVTQSSSRAILNWSSFDISADGKVVFQQPSAAAVALNKIYEQNPSTILGQLTANGQIYLINPNGFVFGAGATVNTAGLIASSLGLYSGDAEFTGNTLYTQSTQAPYNPAFGTPGVTPGSIVVQPGATISVADQGDILLAGQTVSNGGVLSAPDGQVVLAAGQTAYLTTSSNPLLRGLIVEVTGQGQVTNQANAVISAPRGNVSLVGLAVNQDGIISATTAVSANGSVYLEAADGTANGSSSGSCQPGEALCGIQGGTLTIGSSSQISIQPDASQGTAVVAQAQNPSQIQLTGQQVDIDGGSISAPGGSLTATAAVNPDQPTNAINNSGAQIRIGSGVQIDLAGSQADLPMSANLLSIQLLANELEDDPEQRDGALHGQTAIVDLRDGKPALISESSWESALEGIEESIYQRTAAGGNAVFQSQGDILFSSGASINVSGGAWNYAAGVTQTSELVAADGQIYNIADASPALIYSKVLNPTYTQTYSGYGVQVSEPTPGLGHDESGYSEGFSAGSVTFAAPAMALQGTLQASALDGAYQRNAASIPATSLAALVANINSNPAVLTATDPFPATGAPAMASGGTLQIGEPVAGLSGGILPEFFAPAVTLVSSPAAVAVPDGTPLGAQTLQLPAAYLTGDGFSATDIYSDAAVTLPAGLPLDLGAGSALHIVAPLTVLDSSIEALGGSIEVQTAQTSEYQAAGGARAGIDIGQGVTLKVSGQWTNDSMYAPPSIQGATYQNGGSIDLSLTSPYDTLMSGGALALGNDVSLLANGGAWVQYTNSITGGTGGSIVLDASPYQSALQVGSDVTLQGFGVEGAAGGSFALNAPRIALVNGSWSGAQSIDDLTEPGEVFDVGAALFSQSGFTNVSLTATAPVVAGASSNDVLTVLAGTSITPAAQSLQLEPSFLVHGTGGTVQGMVQAETLPESQQLPGSVLLSVAPASTDPNTTVSGDLDMQAGSSILAGPGSSLTLSGQGSVWIDGALRAPGGSIVAQIGNPNTELNDPGYLAGQTLQLGSQAVLDASGTVVSLPNTLNLPLGNVIAGGNVQLITDRGQIITDPGSAIDISGASARLDVQPSGSLAYEATTVGSAAGSLLVQSSESISLLGTLSASAGASSTGTLQGGTLQIDLSGIYKGTLPSTANPFPASPYTIELLPSTAGASPSSAGANLAVLGVDQLQQSGVDALSLQADSTIDLGASIALSMGRQISLDAPTIAVAPGAIASLQAPYVAFTNSQQQTAPLPATAGTGSLAVSAQQISLSSFTTLDGVQDATLFSSGDVEFLPYDLNYLTGGLTLAGDLAITAARVYPATNASYTVQTTGDVTIGSSTQNTANPVVLLSANGSLTIDADNITSSGTILAPFGQIDLNATGALSLLAGSVTSVSADGAVIPYGLTAFGGEEWIYQAGNAQIGLPATPTRELSLNGQQISVASGATVDLSGGGDLTAYEWIPGTGGSIDALGQANATAQGYYAVVPSQQGAYAAYDLQEFTGSSVGIGSSVYLSASPGLPAGMYTLLPARYALLPGAFLIQEQSAYSSLAPGTLGTLSTGAPVVAGYFTFGNTNLRTTNGYTGFAVYAGGPGSSSYSQSLAQYSIISASSFFGPGGAGNTGTAVALPADAGTLAVDVGSTLSLLGTVNAAAATGGNGATIEIYTAPGADLTVSPTQAAAAASGVTIAAPSLASWNAGNLVLGGVLSDDGSSVEVTAGSVTIGAGAQVSAGQVLVVADQDIDVQGGATVASTSGLSGTPLKTLPPVESLTLESDVGGTEIADPTAALLALSDSELPIALRSASAGTGATLDIESGATLATRGAVALDAPGEVTINGSVNAPGANWSLASSSIAFVGNGTTSADTLQIGQALLQQMQSAGAISLTSAGSIDLLTPVMLGASSATAAPSLTALTLNAVSLNNDGGSSTFAAQTMTLEGSGSSSGTAALPAVTGGSGTLSLLIGTLGIAGTGSLVVNGNSQTTIEAGTSVEGRGGTLALSGNVTIAAPQLTAASESSTAVGVQGSLQITQNGAAAAPGSLASSLGGALSLSANQIQDTGSIIVPGGSIALQSTGSLSLGAAGAGALVDAGGIDVTAAGTPMGAAGGLVAISAGGDLSLTNATISVAGAGNSPAGAIALDSAGTTTLSATSFDGAAAGGATGGSFTLQAAQLSGGLGALPQDQSGDLLPGFTNQIDIQVNSGDLDLAASESMTANQIALTTDTGAIDIAGVLSAPSAGERGSLQVFAGGNLTVQSTAQLLAQASGNTGQGGEIELSAGSATNAAAVLTIADGSTIAASGQGGMGSLWLRAPALSNGNALGLSANLAGGVASGDIDVGTVYVEPELAPIQSGADFTLDPSPIESAVSNYLARVPSVAALPASLQIRSGATEVLQPAVLIQAPGNLTLSQPLDLTQLGLGAPIDLTVQAAGSIAIDAPISGFTLDAGDTGAASTLRFVAGADLASANPLSTVAGSAANLALGAGALVQTSTGELDLVAANNVTFAAGASAYTTGNPINATPQTITLGGNDVPVYFPSGGGNLVVRAGNDVVGTAIQAPISAWQARTDSAQLTGTTSGAALGEWGINLTAFDAQPWSLATFGGGDLRVSAGADITNLSAASADSMLLDATGTVQTPVQSGGLSISAGGNVINGQYFVADGSGTLTVGRSLTVSTPTGATTPSGTLFALQNAAWSMWAQGDITVDAVVDPTVLTQPQATGSLASVAYFTYGADSSFSAQSSAGDVTLANTQPDLQHLVGQQYEGKAEDFDGAFLLMPATLSLTSLSQSLQLGSGLLYPTSSGQLNLFAAQNIVGGGQLTMSDAPDAVLSTASHVTSGPSGISTLLIGPSGSGVSQYDFYGDLHASDPNPAMVVAGGDIDELSLSIPKASVIEAGGDIVDLNYTGQNLNPTDLTLIRAGGSVTDAPSFDPTSGDVIGDSLNVAVQISGPGSLDVLAGKDIDLGFSQGVAAVGNLVNGSLAPVSANITMAAGLGQQPDDAAFLQQIIEPSATYQQQLINYVQAQTGQTGLSAGEADAQFAAFSSTQQNPFIDAVFFNELSLSGEEANSTAGAGYTRGYAAIAALFPGSPTGANGNSSAASPYLGDLDLTYSDVESDQGGNLALLVPGGAINVGLAQPPGSLLSVTKQPSQLGIIAQGGGNVDVYSEGSVNVNSSRIFGVGGGNILIWSEEGNIDAGQGAKSSLSIPPPTVVINPATGQVTLDYSDAVAGSGIRTIQTSATQAAGSVNLIAPVGSVNAGDAGIAAAGNINIAAAVVTGVSNISFGGTATGVPALVSNVSGSLSSAASTASAATTNASASLAQNTSASQQQQAPLAQAALSWLDVFVTGLGEENCDPQDTQCLQREQRRPSP